MRPKIAKLRMEEESVLRTRASLLASAGRGNELAWVQLVELYSPLLRQWAIQSQRSRGLTKLNEADLEDAISEVLMALVRILAQFQYDPALTFRGYLRRMLGHELSKIANRRLQLAGDSLLTDLQMDTSTTNDCIDIIVKEEEKMQTAAVLLAARSRFREESTWLAWEQTELYERSVPEVAKELGISSASVYSNRRRVRQTILEVSQQMFGEQLDNGHEPTNRNDD